MVASPLKRLSLIYLATSVSCLPQPKHQWQSREISTGDVAEAYDFIVVGGGQSGLVVANRLSEDANNTVLVVEYGYFDNRPEQLDPYSVGGLINWPKYDMCNVTSTPQAGLLGNTVQALAGAVVSGGSTVNGMLLTRGSADDYDNWAKLNDEPGWGFQGLLPSFKKSATFQEPLPELAHDYNIAWDQNAYGQGSPIYESIASYQFPGTLPQWKGMEEAGLTPQTEGAGGKVYGIFWFPNAIDNETVTRSYAVRGYYTPVADRANLHLLTGHRVNEITFDANLGANGVHIKSREDSGNAEVTSVRVNKEVVLAAGAFHSPQILQRSGIGPSSVLTEAGIEVLVDLPGLMPDSWISVVETLQNQNSSEFLPASYTTEQLAGFEVQRRLFLDSLQRDDNAVIKIPFNGSSWFAIVGTKGMSRGTVHVDPADRYAEPVLDFGTFRNPIDVRFMVGAIEFARRWHETPAMVETFGPVGAVQPAANITDYADLEQIVRRSTSGTIGHISGTCSMMPRHLGGVVGTDLRVYGAADLIKARHNC
ncbi:hypothetical protein LQW54_004017 [Pestalotiopsis sp. IQ-011]